MIPCPPAEMQPRSFEVENFTTPAFCLLLNANPVDFNPDHVIMGAVVKMKRLPTA